MAGAGMGDSHGLALPRPINVLGPAGEAATEGGGRVEKSRDRPRPAEEPGCDEQARAVLGVDQNDGPSDPSEGDADHDTPGPEPRIESGETRFGRQPSISASSTLPRYERESWACASIVPS